MRPRQLPLAPPTTFTIIRISQPVAGQGGTFVPMVVITEQMVRLPLEEAPLSLLDAFQSS